MGRETSASTVQLEQFQCRILYRAWVTSFQLTLPKLTLLNDEDGQRKDANGSDKGRKEADYYAGGRYDA
jgi:hypothetical protein